MQLTNRDIFRILGVVTIYVGALYLAVQLKTQLIWIGTAFFLALALNPMVERLARRMPRKSRSLATGVVFIILLASIVLVGYLLVPPLVSQTQNLLQDLPGYAQRLQDSESLVGRWIERYDLVDKIQNNQQQIISRLSSTGVGVAQGVFSGLIATITILTLTFFMIVEGPKWIGRFWYYHPKRHREHRQKLAMQMYQVISGYVTGRLFIALIAAVVSGIFLSLIGVPSAIPLAILVGLLDLVPLVGATLGSVIVIAVTLLNSLSMGIITAIFFVIYQQLENNVLQPLVDSRTVQLSPMLVLMSAIIGVSIGGLVGALVAIPAAGCLQILARDFLSARHPKD